MGGEDVAVPLFFQVAAHFGLALPVYDGVWSLHKWVRLSWTLTAYRCHDFWMGQIDGVKDVPKLDFGTEFVMKEQTQCGSVLCV